MPVAPLALLGLGAGAPDVDQRVPLDHLELDLDADLGEVLLDELVHRQRLHLARARGRDQDLDRRAACPGRSRPRPAASWPRPDRTSRLKVGLPNHWWPGGQKPFGRDHQAAEQLLHALAVDREIGGLAHADVVPGRALDAREVPGPVVRIGVGDDLEAGRLRATATASGAGASIQSTWPERSAATRALASGSGSSTSLSSFGTRALSQ